MKKNSGRADYHCYNPGGWDAVRMWAETVLAIGALAFFFYRSILALLPLSIVGYAYQKRYRKKKLQKRKEQLTMQFKECILSVSTSLQAGYAVENAFVESREDMRNLFGEASDIYRELEWIRRGLIINITLEELLADFAKRSGCEEVEQFAQIFQIAKKKGGNLTDILKNTVSLISQKIDAKQEIQTVLSGKELEQTMMKGMPFFFLCYIGVTTPGFFDPLYHNLSGVLIMTLCLALYLASYILSDVILENIGKNLDGRLSGKTEKVLKGLEKASHSATERLCSKILSVLRGRDKRKADFGAVGNALKRLYPGEEKERLVERYYLEKLQFSLLLLGIGGAATFAYVVKSRADPQAAPGGVVFLISALLTVALYFLKDKDLYDQVEKQKQSLRMQYPDVVHQLVLYLGAGMSMRGSFQMLAKDYEMVLFACREFATGISEALVYDRFGKRTGLQEYIRLGTLLAQNLKKGNATLLGRLEEEAEKASRERIQAARRIGEEAGTKLLFPMMLLLLTVMIMIMVPAFSGLEI